MARASSIRSASAPSTLKKVALIWCGMLTQVGVTDAIAEWPSVAIGRAGEDVGHLVLGSRSRPVRPAARRR